MIDSAFTTGYLETMESNNLYGVLNQNLLNKSFVRSALIVGYIVVVLVIAGLAKA